MKDGGIAYKLPAEFMEKHGDLVRAWDWARSPILKLREALPDVPALADVSLHFFGEGGARIVRPLGGGSAIRLRRYNDTLPQQPKPTREKIAAVLARRNPKPAETQE
jgi:hypothetical protein